MQFLVVLAVLVSLHVVLASSPDLTPSDAGDDKPGGHKGCKPVAPAVNNLKLNRFAGLWYLDSSTTMDYATSSCLALNFLWSAHPFDHDHRHYAGFFNYKLRNDRDNDLHPTTECYKMCSFASQGYLHGWLKGGENCSFGGGETAMNATTRGLSSGEDPCHPHYESHWDLWVMKTDYKRYALLWLCSDFSPYVLLLSRHKSNLPMHIRQEVETFLQKHGYNGHQLILTHNTSC